MCSFALPFEEPLSFRVFFSFKCRVLLDYGELACFSSSLFFTTVLSELFHLSSNLVFHAAFLGFTKKKTFVE